MRVLIAFDKFKSALTARQACDVAARALRPAHPDWTFDLCPIADGGDGFMEIFTRAAGGRIEPFRVTGPRGGWIEANIGFVSEGKIPGPAREILEGSSEAARASARVPNSGTVAVVEMAAASGLALLAPELRDPWQASTYGTGQLIRAAAELGAGAVLLGVGGSATHDLGLGALGALGLEYRSARGKKISPLVPAAWTQLAAIEGEVFGSLPPIRIACDVTNPLLGPDGAVAVFAAQKGLKAGDGPRLEAESARMAALLCDHCGRPASLAAQPGAGAAGGLAFGLMAAAGARLLPGFGLAAAWLDLDARMAAADLVLTGEGSFDESSLGGKGPGAIVARARGLGKPAHVFAGKISGAGESPFLHAITPEGMPLPQALRETAANLAAALGKAF